MQFKQAFDAHGMGDDEFGDQEYGDEDDYYDEEDASMSYDDPQAQRMLMQ
jgi:hypothetical protein